MAKRSLEAMADLIEDMVDKSQSDSTFDGFVQNMLVLTLQEIISEVPYARWLLEEHSITLTADQQYVTAPTDMDIDAIVTLRDDTNNTRTMRITPDIADAIDPGRDLSGPAILWWTQRVGGADRIYFINKPDATDSLTLISGEIITDPTSAQTTALPAKYEWVWIAMTMPKIWERLDATHDTRKWEKTGIRGMTVITRDANSLPAGSEVIVSHRPGQGDHLVHGASFPSNFDVSP